MTTSTTLDNTTAEATRQAGVMRRARKVLKFFTAFAIIAAPFVFPKLAPILVPGGVLALIVLLLVGPKSERKWTWMTPARRRKSLDENSKFDITNYFDQTNPFRTH
jgi:hypothetical protein